MHIWLPSRSRFLLEHLLALLCFFLVNPTIISRGIPPPPYVYHHRSVLPAFQLHKMKFYSMYSFISDAFPIITSMKCIFVFTYGSSVFFFMLHSSLEENTKTCMFYSLWAFELLLVSGIQSKLLRVFTYLVFGRQRHSGVGLLDCMYPYI